MTLQKLSTMAPSTGRDQEGCEVTGEQHEATWPSREVEPGVLPTRQVQSHGPGPEPAFPSVRSVIST